MYTPSNPLGRQLITVYYTSQTHRNDPVSATYQANKAQL